MNIGNIIYDYSNNKELGVIVYPLDDRYILFKLEANTHPMFSRLPLSEANTITTTGNINETNNQNLKMHLLKYYRQHNLSENEKKLLGPLMNYAYPNGIPEYKTTTPNSNAELEHMNLIDKLKKGNRFYINTTSESPFEYLNEQKAHIIDMNENGIWIGYQDGNKTKLAFLPYSNKSSPTFHGISKLIPINTSVEKDPIVNQLESELTNRRKNGVLYNVIEHNNEVIKLNEANEVITPKTLTNSYYDFAKNKILLIKPENNNDITKLHELIEKKPDAILIGKEDTQYTKLIDEVNEADINSDDNIFYGGDIKSNIKDNEILLNLNSKIKLDNEYLEELKQVDNSFINDYESDNSSENNDSDLEIIDEEIEILETVDKVQQKPVPELEKVLDESIQMSNIRKYKIEKIPVGLRRNQRLLNKLTNKIQKEVNLISFMKSITTNPDNSIKYRSEDFKPLVEEYCDYDYQNNFLTPLVVTNKRIYITPSDKVRNYDSAIINENILEVFKEINKDKLINKKRIINYKEDIAKLTSDFNPYPQYDIKPVGISVIFGSGKTKKYNSYLNSLENEESSSIALESIAARLNIQRLSQDTEVIRYGLGKDFEYDNYGGLWDDNKNYDSYKAMGPLVYFKEKEKQDLAVLEAKIDKHIANVNPSYDIIYKGDITNLVGFIRMPIKKYINGNKVTKSELSDSNKVEVKYLDELLNEQYNAMIEPEKSIVYLFSKDMHQINEVEYKEYLQMVIPSVEDIIEYINATDSNGRNNLSTSKAIKLLNKMYYFINSDSILIDSKTDKQVKLTYSEYNSLRDLLDDDIKLYEDLNNELTKRYKNKKEKRVKQEHKIVSKSIIELCNDVYSTKLNLEEFDYMTDKQVVHYYKKEVDSGRYFDLQLQKHKYDNITGSKEALENTLSILKNKYDTLTNSIGSSDKICRQAKKPNIVLYESIERLMEDNGKVITNSSGNLINAGDYAYVEVSGGEKYLYKREALTDGDYWLEQPLTELDKLMDKETENCKTTLEEREKMELDNKAVCNFDVSALSCMEYNPVNNEINEIEEEIRQTISSIDLLDRLPGIKDNLANELTNQEQRIRLKLSSLYELSKHKLEIAMKSKIVESEENKCIHNKAINKIRAMVNLVDAEKYLYYYEIINQFQNIEHTELINLEKVELENIEANYLQCGNCHKRLICKHYLFAANQINERGEIDYELFKDIYAEDMSGSYYCRICGVWLFNTDVEDDIQFGSGEGGGKVIAAREVIEDQSKDLIAKNKDYINKLINNTLSEGANNIKEDIEIRLKLYTLFKKLSGIKSLLMDDEITMINYIKSYNYTPKTTFVQLFKAKFAGKGVGIAVIEKYADIKYKQNYVLELAGIFMIIVQCGGYSVFNKFAGNIIQGYPLLDDSDLTGIGYMSRLIQSVAELYEFMAEWKRDNSGSYDVIKGRLLNIVKKGLLKDDYLVNKIDSVLNDQFNISSFESERANKSSNYWNIYKPKVGRISWKPEKDIVFINKDNIGKFVDKQLDILQEQIDYSSMNIISLIYGYVHKLDPVNIHYLRSRIVNSSMPINFNKLNETTGKYKNPEINYYNKVFDNVSGIQANISNIAKYTEMKNKLTDLNEMIRIKINAITEFKLNRINVGNGSINLTKEELEYVSDKFITSGEYRGIEHIYDKYNICIVSNQFKDSNIAISQMEYPDLLTAIQQKHILLLQNNEFDKVLLEIIDILKKLKIDNITEIIYKYNENTEFANKLYGYIRQYKALIELEKNNLMKKKLTPELSKSMEIVEISIKRLVLQDIKENKIDTSKMLFSLISNMNTLIQNNISSLVDKLSNNKEKRTGLEDILIRIGYMSDIISDYKKVLIEQENVINYLVSINYDKKTDDYSHYIISGYLSKMFNYVNVLINMLINNNWVNDTNIIQYHYKKYYRYGNSKAIFKEYSNMLQDINEIYEILNIIEEGNNCFNYEYIKVFKMYIFIYMLNNIISIKKSTEVINNIKDNKAFSFYSYVDTSLDIEEENINEEITKDNELKIIGGDVTNNDFVEKIEKQKISSNKLMIEFVLDIIEDIFEYQTLYNKMNDSNRTSIKEKTKQEQTRLNLDTLKALKNNYDTDYNLIIQKMKMGSFSYSELYEKVKEQMGEDIIDDYVESYNDNSGGNYDLGDESYDMVEAEEIGELSVAEAEDMENYEADYGNMAVD
jgi:uncharacterized CHY-type Zn-finger protein